MEDKSSREWEVARVDPVARRLADVVAGHIHLGKGLVDFQGRRK